MIGFFCLDEAPLCSLPITDNLFLRNTLTLNQSVSGGRVYTVNIASNLTFGQSETLAKGFSVSNNLNLSQIIIANSVYKIPISQSLVLTSNGPPSTQYKILKAQQVNLAHGLTMNTVLGYELCDSIPLIHRLGWIVEVSMSNTINFHDSEFLDNLYNTLVFDQTLTTNMDDISCSSPFGISGDKNLRSKIIFHHVLDANVIYVCESESVIEIFDMLYRR